MTDDEKRQLLARAEEALKETRKVQKRIKLFDKWSKWVAIYITVPVGIVFSFWGILFLLQDNNTKIILNNYTAGCWGLIGMGFGLVLMGISYFLTFKNFIGSADSFIMLAATSAFAISFAGISFMWINAELGVSIIIFSIVICVIQFIKIGATALNESVNDPKDRLTIIVAIIGSLIALIALFKKS